MEQISFLMVRCSTKPSLEPPLAPIPITTWTAMLALRTLTRGRGDRVPSMGDALASHRSFDRHLQTLDTRSI